MTLGMGVRRDVVLARNNYVLNVALSTEASLVIEAVRDEGPGRGLLALADHEQPFRLGGNIRDATLPS
jgi:hypothetical protein